MTDEQILSSYGYKLVTVAEFNAAPDVPDGLRVRVAENLRRWPGKFVVYDPNDDCEGFLLVGPDRDALAKETVQHNELSEQASLF